MSDRKTSSHRHRAKGAAKDSALSPGQARVEPRSAAAPPPWALSAARRGFWIVLAASCVTQALHWLSVRANDPLYAQVFDGWDMSTYWLWAAQIFGGDWLSATYTSGRPFYYGPLYPYFLAGMFLVFGKSFGAVHVVQAILGVAPPLALWAASRRLFGSGAALTTGLLAAFCGPFLFYGQMLLMEGWLVAFHSALLWLLVLGQDSGRRSGIFCAAGAGVLAGAACWGRGNFVLVIPALAMLWIVAPLRMAKESGKPATGSRALLGRGCVFCIAFCAGATLTLGLTLWRNVHVSGHWSPVTSNGPVLFFIGNAPDSTGTFGYPPSFTVLNNQYNGDAPWLKELEKSIRRDPGAFLLLMAKKAWMFWNSYDIPDNVSYYFNKRFSWLFRLTPVNWLTLVPLGLLGLWETRRLWRRQLFLYGYTAAFVVSIIVVFVVGRYRLQTLLPMLVWAGPGVAGLASRLRERQWRGAVLRIAVAGILMAILWPSWSPAARLNMPEGVPGVRLARPSEFTHFANAYKKIGRMDECKEVLEDSVEENPWYQPAVGQLVELYQSESQPAKAQAAWRKYAQWWENQMKSGK